MLTRKRYYAIPILIVILLATFFGGCDNAPAANSEGGVMQVSEHLVPDVPLDIYVYLEQDRPTVVPAGTLETTQDTEVVSMAIWGVPYNDTDFSIGGALNFTNADDAASVYATMDTGNDTWLKLDGSTIYVVSGSGAAAATLRTALDNRDFKKYDDSDGLEAASQLPDGGGDDMVAIALVRPSEALIRFITEEADPETTDMITGVLALIQLKTAAAGVYAEEYVSGEKITELFGGGGGIYDSGLSVVAIVNASLPGIIVTPLVEKFLPEQGFTEETYDKVKVFIKQQMVDNNGNVFLAICIDGSKLVVGAAAAKDKALNLVLEAR